MTTGGLDFDSFMRKLINAKPPARAGKRRRTKNVAEEKTLQLAGREVKVTQVEIVQRSNEGMAEYVLEDGGVIRVANPVAVVYRMHDTKDAEGNPLYLVRVGTAVTTVKAPKSEAGAKKANDSSN